MRTAPLVLAVASIIGCGDDGGNAPPPDAGEPPPPDATPADAPPCVPHGGEVRENMPGVDDFTMLPPLEGVTVTAYVGVVEVASWITPATGAVDLCVPPDTSVALAFTKESFYAQAFLRVTDADGRYLDVRMFRESDLCPIWMSLGATCPSTTSGFVSVATLDSTGATPLAGVSGSIAPASGTGPHYFDDTFSYDPGLMETSSVGFFVFGNVQPGLADVALDHATLPSCAQEDGGFLGGTPNTIRIPVFAGVDTSVVVRCE